MKGLYLTAKKQLASKYVDTRKDRAASLHLIQKFGFRRIEKYNDKPFAELFFEHDLSSLIPYKGRISLISRKDIDHGKEFDWGSVSKEYARYRGIYPSEFYQRIVDLGLCVHGQTVLDIGTGTGVLPRNLYRYGADWTGIDLSESQIAEAIRLTAENDMKIRFIVAPAENTGLPDGTFDVITACQCFMYFDPAYVLPEILRLLKPDGRLLILFMGWLPFESEIARASEDLVLEYNPSWTGGRYRRSEAKIPDWSKKYFKCVHCCTYDVGVSFTRESWHGRIIACRGRRRFLTVTGYN